MVDTAERDILTLPDFDDVQASKAFLITLEAQSTRHGVRKLLSHSETILRYKVKLKKETELAERALLVVNGQRTPLQAIKDKMRYARSNAEKFYSSMSRRELLTLCNSMNLDVEDFSPVTVLADYYVHNRIQELAEQYNIPVAEVL